jgi:hypothetical protein
MEIARSLYILKQLLSLRLTTGKNARVRTHSLLLSTTKQMGPTFKAIGWLG